MYISGDAYRYTIQPNFRHFSEFQCHLRHKPPKVLYTLFFHIKIPGPYGPESELETPRVYKTVYAQDFGYQSRGEFQADYIAVEHTSGLNLHDEFIFVGQERKDTNRMNYTVYALKKPEEFTDKKVVVHEIANNVYVATTQFSSPFAYSTSSWTKGNDCDKDVTKFKYQERNFKDHTGQPVNALIQSIAAPYEYYLKSVDNPPYIRFMVPGKHVVITWTHSWIPSTKDW